MPHTRNRFRLWGPDVDCAAITTFTHISVMLLPTFAKFMLYDVKMSAV